MKYLAKIFIAIVLMFFYLNCHAYEFNGLYIFGDSLSSGKVWNSAAPNQTGTGHNWHYYFRQTFSPAVYENYATGGWETGTILNSVYSYINAVPSLDSDSLYFIWGGANDHSIYAGNIEASVDAIYNAGGRKIIVANLHDNPYKSTGQIIGFNNDLHSRLNNSSADVIQMDVYSLMNEIYQNPSFFGFSYSEVLTDGLHLSDKSHRILSDYFSSVLEAPVIMVSLPEIPLSSARFHYEMLDSSLTMLHASKLNPDDMIFSSQLSLNEFTLDDSKYSCEADTSSMNVAGVLHYQFNLEFAGGIGLSFQNTDTDFSAGKGDASLSSMFYSAYLSYEFQKILFHLFLSGGSLSYDINRLVELDTVSRIESSDPSGSYSSYKVSCSRIFALPKDVSVTPFISYNSQTIDINGFSEDGSNASAMTFSSQTRDSAVACFGSSLSLPKETAVGKTLFFGKIYYESELENSRGSIRSNVKNLSGTTFLQSGIDPESSALNLSLGMKVELPHDVDGYVTYHYRKGSDSSEYSINAGIQYHFDIKSLIIEKM